MTASSRGEATRTRILDRARSVLVDDGYDALVLRQVAADLDMRVSNVQYYFPTRDDLVFAVIEAEVSLDIAAIAATNDDNPHVALAAAVDTLIARWRSDSGIVLTVMGFLRTQKPEIRDLYRRTYLGFYDELEAVLARIGPGQPADEYKRRARLITALLDGAAMQVDVGRWTDFTESIRDLVEAVARPKS